MNTGLDQYMDIFKDAVEDSAAKLTKSFEKILIEVIILFMVIPRKINFTQMGRYGSHVEQTYRNAKGMSKCRNQQDGRAGIFDLQLTPATRIVVRG